MTGRRTILVVDDDEFLVEFVRTALEGEGYEVVTASDGWSAFEQLGDVVPALILLDVRMPEMSGSEFAEVYRKFPGENVPIVVMTGTAEGLALADSTWVNAYLRKPFGLDELTAVVNQYTRKGASRESAAPDR